MKCIELIGIDGYGKQARIGNDVIMFGNIEKKVSLVKQGNKLILTGNQGQYDLVKHPELNIYQGKCNGYKVHVSLKKTKGELRYW